MDPPLDPPLVPSDHSDASDTSVYSDGSVHSDASFPSDPSDAVFPVMPVVPVFHMRSVHCDAAVMPCSVHSDTSVYTVMPVFTCQCLQ